MEPLYFIDYTLIDTVCCIVCLPQRKNKEKQLIEVTNHNMQGTATKIVPKKC